MGICYTYLLYDDFDWDYTTNTKDKVIEEIKKDLPVATILAQWYQYIVVDLNKNWSDGDNAQSLHKYCDVAYYYTDSNPSYIQKVKFNKKQV